MADKEKPQAGDPELEEEDAPIGWNPNTGNLNVRKQGEPKPEENLIVIDPDDDDDNLPEDFNEYDKF